MEVAAFRGERRWRRERASTRRNGGTEGYAISRDTWRPAAPQARRVAIVAVLVIVCSAVTTAQFRRGNRFRSIRTPTADTFQGSFNFCRIMFQSSRGGDGGNWSVDYPRADVNLTIRA